MKVPENLLYTKEHEWISKKDNVVKVGITDFAQSQLGDIIFLELPEVGDQIIAGESFGEIEAVKTVSDLFMPISGEISSFNEALEDAPEKVNEDPYGEGWMIRIKGIDAAEVEALLSADAYKSLIAD